MFFAVNGRNSSGQNAGNHRPELTIKLSVRRAAVFAAVSRVLAKSDESDREGSRKRGHHAITGA
jgi:hypothetical protein